MLIEETIKIKAPIRKIWETMLDVSILLSCIPGVENLEIVDENTYHAVLKTKVSIVTATFDTVINIINRQEPIYIKVVGEGKGRMGTGRVVFNQAISLESISDNETNVAYKLELNVIGRLAALGGKAIVKKVNEVSGAFRNSFTAKCESL